MVCICGWLTSEELLSKIYFPEMGPSNASNIVISDLLWGVLFVWGRLEGIFHWEGGSVSSIRLARKYKNLATPVTNSSLVEKPWNKDCWSGATQMLCSLLAEGDVWESSTPVSKQLAECRRWSASELGETDTKKTRTCSVLSSQKWMV